MSLLKCFQCLSPLKTEDPIGADQDKYTPIIVFDFGGTHFRHALFYPRYDTLDIPYRKPTPSLINYPNFSVQKLQNLLIEEVITVIECYRSADQRLNTVGISFPAPLTSSGMIYRACTIYGDQGDNFPLLKRLREKLPHIKFVIVNDLTASTARYAALTKYQNIDFLGVLLVHTGLGGKIYDMCHRHVLLDQRGLGGEIGHVKVDFSEDAPLCPCGGGCGHLESWSSGRAIQQRTIALSQRYLNRFKESRLYDLVEGDAHKIDYRHIICAIQNRDVFCSEILEQSTFYLAQGISLLSTAIGVDQFIIIGEFATTLGIPYLDSLKRNLLKMDWYNRPQTEVMHMVDLGFSDRNDGLIGVGLLACHH